MSVRHKELQEDNSCIFIRSVAGQAKISSDNLEGRHSGRYTCLSDMTKRRHGKGAEIILQIFEIFSNINYTVKGSFKNFHIRIANNIFMCCACAKIIKRKSMFKLNFEPELLSFKICSGRDSGPNQKKSMSARPYCLW